MIKEYIVDIGFEAVKDKLKSEVSARQLRQRLTNYIERQSKVNMYCTTDEELDFERLASYVMNELIDDAKKRLLGTHQEREIARKTILNKSITYAQANTKLSRDRTVKFIDDVMNILRDFYRGKTNSDLLFVAAQIEDTTSNLIARQTDKINNEISASEKRIVEKINCALPYSLEANMNLIKEGNIAQAESNIEDYLNAIGSTHCLRQHYRFEFEYKTGRLYSKPLTEDAIRQYPPKLLCTGTVQISGKYIDKLDTGVLEYAYRHQLPITLNVETAKKYLGDIEDPIQHEAEDAIGQSFVVPPKPFPPAFPCSISVEQNVAFDYVLFRTQEILDDGTIIASNTEQTDFPFQFTLAVKLEERRVSISIATKKPNNQSLLKYARFVKHIMDGLDISIRVLSSGAILAKGVFNKVEYSLNNESLEKEIDFLEKIVSIEEYFNESLCIPEDITTDDFFIVSYMATLIKGDIRIASWEKLEDEISLTDDLKQKILSATEESFPLTYLGSISVSLYGKVYELPIIRTFSSAKYFELDRLKAKANVLDIGDKIKLVFVPGQTNELKESLNKEIDVQKIMKEIE